MKKLTTLILMLTAICGISSATVLIANNNSNAPIGHYPTLQGAITAANNGDTIYVVGSPNVYDGNGDINLTHDSLTLIGAGYLPQKDLNYSSSVLDFRWSNGNGNNCKIFGFEISSILTNLVSNPQSGNNLEIAYNYFVPYFIMGYSSQVQTGANCNFHDNIFTINNSSFFTIAGDNNIFHNNIFTSTVAYPQNLFYINPAYSPQYFNNVITNNHFLSVGGGYVFYNIQNFNISNNIFYGCAVGDSTFGNVPTNCDFNDNLTYNTFNNTVVFGSNYSTLNNNYVDTMPVFVNPTSNFAFDFPPYDFSLQTSSIGHNGGTDGTDIGAFGGANSFSNFTGMYNIPQIVKLDLFNTIVGRGDSLRFHSTGYSNLGDSIITAEFFFDTDLGNGNCNTVTIPHDISFNFNYSINHDSLALGSHIFGFRVMNSNGIWSHPEMRSFMVCQVSGSVANFDSYVYGHDVIFLNTSTDQQFCHWDFGNADSSNSVISPLVHHFDSVGVFNVCLNAGNICTPSGNTICKPIAIKGIKSITPNKGGNIGIVTLTITGALFDDSTSVQLRDSSGAILTPVDSSTIVTNGIQIQTAFDLKGVALGKYDVIVTVPGDTIFTVNKGFEVDSGKFPLTYVKLLGPNYIHMNDLYSYSLIVGNKGNIDAIGVPVWLAVPINVEVIPEFQVTSQNDTTIFWDTIPYYIIKDTLFSQNNSFKVYGFIIPFISGGTTEILNLKIRTYFFQTFQMYYWSSREYVLTDSSQLNRITTNSTCFMDPDKLDCIKEIATTVAGIGGPEAVCAANYIMFNFQILNNATCYANDKNNKLVKSIIHDFIEATISCLGGFTPQHYQKAIKLLVGIFDLMNDGNSNGIISPCIKSLFQAFVPKNNISTIASFDPNEKYGSTGVLNSPYINSNEMIGYYLHFENIDTATAPAQIVLILDTLDKINLDLNSFQLNQISFGDTLIPIPSGRKSFTTDVDLQPTMPLIARVAAYLNDSTGIVTYSFVSLDPLTMEPTTDPLLGFLPPNDSSGRGEGSVSYSIKAKDNIATGTIINNKADIYFDTNAPITTQTWNNVIDNLKPQSQVNTLTPFQNSDTIIVSWSGSDNGPAGLYAYNVYYNVNGGQWLLWKYNTSLTTDTFVGVLDSTYGFYSIAIDSALNVEGAPLTADATTTITVGINEIAQSQMIVKLFPNPANNSLNIYIKRFDYSKNDFNIIARDITGRTIRTEKINLTTDVKTMQLDISQFVSGVYFFEITDGTHRSFKKLIKN